MTRSEVFAYMMGRNQVSHVELLEAFGEGVDAVLRDLMELRMILEFFWVKELTYAVALRWSR